MSIGALLGFLSLAGWLILIVGVGLAIGSGTRGVSPRRGMTLAVAGVAIGVVFAGMSAGVVEVAPDKVAVIFQRVGGDDDALLDQPLRGGVHVIMPILQEPTIYSVAQQEYTMSGVFGEGAVAGSDAVVARTRDGQEVRIDLTVIYAIEADKANIIHLRWRDRYQDDLVRPTLRGMTRAAVGEFRVEEVYGERRAELETEIQDRITQRFAEEGLTVSDLLIRDISFTPEYQDSIEQKQIAEQQAQQAAFRVQQQQQEAEQARVRAQGEADAVRIRAEGEAQAIRVRASAEAEALRLINRQLSQNPALLQWRYVERLADNISLVLLPSNSPFLFDLEQLAGQTRALPASDVELDPTDAVLTPEPVTPEPAP